MTNKTERFLVMSETEFETALMLRAQLSSCPGYVALKLRPEYDKAEAACRMRPVPEWAEFFTNDLYEYMTKAEEIKK